MELKFKVQTRIQKPVSEVFEAVCDPTKLSGYFTNGGASGPIEEGKTLTWKFDDNPGQEPFAAEVMVTKLVKNELIAFDWQGGKDHLTHIEIKFERADDDDDTIVQITEAGWHEEQDDLDRSYGNCMGWSQMLSALKAFAEYGINLRKGAYTGLYGNSKAA